jgi:hypothetical protein
VALLGKYERTYLAMDLIDRSIRSVWVVTVPGGLFVSGLYVGAQMLPERVRRPGAHR